MSQATSADSSVAATAPGKASSLWRVIAPGLRSKVLASIFDQGLVSATNFLTAVIIGRMAGQDALGTYTLAFSVMLIMLAVQQSLICLPYTVRLHKLQIAEQSRFTASTLLQALVLGIAMSAVVVIVVGVFGGVGHDSVVFISLALAVTMPFILLRDLARRLSFARLDFRDALAVDLGVLAVQAWLLFSLWRFDSLSAATSILAIGIACGVIGLFWLWRHRRSFRFELGSVAADARWGWSLGSWVLGSQSISVMNAYFALWLATALLGTTAAGTLAACDAFVLLSNPLLIGTHNYLAPRLAAAHAEEGPNGLLRVALRVTLFLGTAMALFCATAFVFGDLFIRTLYGEAFGGVGLVCGVVSLAVFAAAVGAAPDHALWIKHRPQISFWTGMLGLAVMIGFAVWWMPLWGLVGGVSAVVLGNSVTSALRWIAFRRLLTQSKAAYCASGAGDAALTAEAETFIARTREFTSVGNGTPVSNAQQTASY